MEKDNLVYVSHMLDTARSAVDKVADVDRAAFDQDENLRLALAHLIQTIGEAARHVPENFRKSHPEIPWKAIVAMRHKVVHDYMHVDFDIVWDVVTTDLPPLVAELERLVQSA
jgi:uncharacterized protein with HEPN domain